jgi:ER degradation enhancer, mannosidase alpha-like 1
MGGASTLWKVRGRLIFFAEMISLSLTVGPYSVKSGQTVYFNDSSLIRLPSVDKQPQRKGEVVLRFWLRSTESRRSGSDSHELSVAAFTALFGRDLNSNHGKKPGRFGHTEGVRVVRHTNDAFGCTSMEKTLDGDVLLVQRGGCTFLKKLMHARDAGASGVVVISDEDTSMQPSAEEPELAVAGELDDVAMVVLTKSDGALVTAMMEVSGSQEIGDLLVTVDLERISNANDWGQKHTSGMEKERELDRLLYLNGHPLLNTRLLA